MGKLEDNLRAAGGAISVVDHLMILGGAVNKPEAYNDIAEGVASACRLDRLPSSFGFMGQAIQTFTSSALFFGLAYPWLMGQVGALREEFLGKYGEEVEPWTEQKLLDLAALARKYHAGHCTEQVAVAFEHLRNHGVKPLDLMIQMPRSLDHVFLVVGRSEGASRSSSWTIDQAPPWGADAVVCDPWSPDKANRAYPASKIPEMMKRPWGVESLFRLEGK
jgi:hypothetical protein